MKNIMYNNIKKCEILRNRSDKMCNICTPKPTKHLKYLTEEIYYVHELIL